MADTPGPVVVLVFSGKRKSGKDYVTDKLKELIGDERCEIMKLSAPLKKQYALEHNLDYAKLMDASEYKEKVRVDMIAWGEARRDADSGYFCRLSTLQSAGVNKPVWIISDARRKTDLEYFRETYPAATVTVRVIAAESTRVQRIPNYWPVANQIVHNCTKDIRRTHQLNFNPGIRLNGGYVFTEQVDDAPSECNLDDMSFDRVIHNNGGCPGDQSESHEQALNSGISDSLELVNLRLRTKQDMKCS